MKYYLHRLKSIIFIQIEIIKINKLKLFLKKLLD